VSLIEWYADHVMVRGRRWALSCPWHAGMLGLGIPSFLLLSAEERAAGWVGHVYTDAYHGGFTEDWRLKAEETKRLLAEHSKQKAVKRIAKLKEDRAGQRWDTRLCKWVTVPVTTGKQKGLLLTQSQSPEGILRMFDPILT
jgi:hypothetical protein